MERRSMLKYAALGVPAVMAMSEGSANAEPQASIHTIEEQRQYQYSFDSDLSTAAMTDRGRKNWEAVGTMIRDNQYGILYKKTI